MNELETEYKILIDEKTFNDILSYYENNTYTQINYYFSSEALRNKKYMLRIRYKNNKYEMTLKIPQNGTTNIEHNVPLTSDEANAFIHHEMIHNDIIDLLKKEMDMSDIYLLTSLKTIRHDIQLQYGMLSLDENEYNGHKDYELEFEINNRIEGQKQFESLCKKHHLHYIKNCPSKIKRALDTL